MYIRILFILLASLQTIAIRAEDNVIPLQIGESFLAKGTGALRVQKNPFLKIQAIPGGLEVFAAKPGLSQLSIGRKQWTFQVFTPEQSRTFQILRKWTFSRLGLKVTLLNEKIVLTGKILRPEDWLGLIKICGSCQFSSHLEMSQEVEAQIENRLEQILKKRGLPNPSLRWNPEGEWLITKKNRQRGLESMAKSLGLQIISQEEMVDVAPMIRTQIFVMEVRREKTRQWGIEWPDSVSAQILPKFQNPIEALMISAHALEKTGEARILANPALLCRSGEQAEFLAGGEFPIKVFSRLQSAVVWRKYGILVKVKPKADRFGKMSLTLETEVSNIDGSRVVDGIPGLLTNRVLSHFDLAKSRTIAISGLIRNDSNDSLKGLPGLSQIPVLGSLFSSREFRENRSELVILVKPETVNLSAENR